MSAVLVLLPPSEGKATPAEGAPVDLQALVFPALTPQRERLLRKLKGVAEAPAAPAAEVYTGVLYQRLGLPDLSDERVLIASALWGVVRPADRIPHYKLPITARVPRVASLGALWRAPLAKVLPDEPGLVLDLRSGGYASLWKPRRATLLGVRGFTEAPDGSRKVISHTVKAVRGDVARAVLLAPSEPATPEEVLEIVTGAGMRSELTDGHLDVIETAP
jgi:cytoplasmic iron level regulating protein YaaA (DUF328/UPF0246 family)